MNELFVDLHIHTNFSDGDLSPEEVVQHARKAGLFAISITDRVSDCLLIFSSIIELSVIYPKTLEDLEVRNINIL